MIFLDLDGVVADLRGGMSMQANTPYPGVFPYSDRSAGYDVVFEDWFSQKQHWREGAAVCKIQFWFDLPLYAWSKALIKALPSLYVLTNPGHTDFASASSAGKVSWCQRHKVCETRRIILTAQKHLLAAPGRVLIDDQDDNINAWKAAGGFGILFPQPWNTACTLITEDPVAYVLQQLKRAHHAD